MQNGGHLFRSMERNGTMERIRVGIPTPCFSPFSAKPPWTAPFHRDSMESLAVHAFPVKGEHCLRPRRAPGKYASHLKHVGLPPRRSPVQQKGRDLRGSLPERLALWHLPVISPSACGPARRRRREPCWPPRSRRRFLLSSSPSVAQRLC